MNKLIEYFTVKELELIQENLSWNDCFIVNQEILKINNKIKKIIENYNEEEANKMNKYESYAVKHYFSEWPEHMGYAEFIKALKNDDELDDCYPVVQYEGIPNEDMAFLVESMALSLENYFNFK